MPEEQKQPSSFVHWAGIFVACVGVIAALIGLATASVNGWFSVSKNVIQDPPREKIFKVDKQMGPQFDQQRQPHPDEPPAAQPGLNGTCNLPGDWEFVMDGQNPSDQLDLPAKFVEGSFVITNLPKEIRSECILSGNAMTLIPPDLNFLGDQGTGVIVMMMPKHYQKAGDNTYVGNTSGTNFYIRRK